ncbi:MAG: STAS domain-containing protein [Terracidiphilus sp.]
MLRERVVIVRHFPETFVGRKRKYFFNEIRVCLNVNRPSLVLECSQLVQMDKQIVLLLLGCLEEAMKRNGDVRLAAVSPQGKAALKTTGVDILFRFFETTEDAIASFQRRPIALPPTGSTECVNNPAA